MPFPLVPDDRPPAITRPSDEAAVLAAEHRKWVAGHGWYVSRDRTLWAGAYQALINQVGAERLHRVLRWYCRQYDRPKPAFGLKLFSGADLKKFFNLVKTAMERDMPDLPPHPLLKDVLGHVTRNPWPAKSVQSLHTSVNLSLHTVDTVLQGLRGIRTKSPLVKRAAKHLHDEIGTPRHFVKAWYDRVWDQVKGWEGWSGSFNQFTVSSNRAPWLEDWMTEALARQFGAKQAGMALDDIQTLLDLEFLK